jgi:hypothetical protein
MARRRSSTSTSTRSSRRSNGGGGGGGGGYGKSAAEARVERLTWGLLVAAFAVLQLVPQTAASFPTYAVPLIGAVVLLGSGIYQNSRHWRVSPITWIGGTLMLVFVILNLYMLPGRSFLGESLIVFALVILFGLFTGET